MIDDENKAVNDLEDVKIMNFSLRDDVVNKTILRSIRRYYLNLFKRKYPAIVRKRFRNVKAVKIFEAVEGLVEKVFPNCQHKPELSDFLYVVLGIKSSAMFNLEDKSKNRGHKVAVCLHRYSGALFSQLFEFWELQTLFCHVYDDNYDKFLNSEKTIKSNRNKYERVMSEIRHSFDC